MPKTAEKPKSKKSKRMGPTIRRNLMDQAAALRGKIEAYEEMRSVHAKKLDEFKRLQEESLVAKVEIGRLNGIIRGLSGQAAHIAKKLGNGHAKKA